MKYGVKERLTEYVRSIGLSKSEFCRTIGVSETYIGSIRKSIQPDKIKSIAINYPNLNTEWLLTGEGKMLRKQEIEIIDAENVESEYSSYNIPEPKPFIDSTYAECGVPNGFSIAIKDSDCDRISIPFIPTTYDFSIKAKGDSMINHSNPSRSIRDKDIVICKLWKSRTHVRWGEVYALATTEGVIIKKILPCEYDNTKIICESFNKEENFPSYELPLEEVLDWATVEGVLSINRW